MEGTPAICAESARSPILQLGGVWHSYGAVTVLHNISLHVERGEFLTLLGPSGSGKSTLLRIIAGLENPQKVAMMLLDGMDITWAPANERNVSTVFQHFALFPHMSVGENVEYSLKLRRIPAPERRRRAESMLSLVRLTGKYDRRIYQLSGGERQRVALARSLVMGPDILLLDEPLGALDERLRLDMQRELIELRRATGVTFILVTHSQEEAVSMSDRIALMRAGTIEQLGSPNDLFSRPQTEFAARFMGFENVMHGILRAKRGDLAEVDVGGATLLGRMVSKSAAMNPGDRVFAAIRAEHVEVDCQRTGNSVTAVRGDPIYKGRYYDIPFSTQLGTLIARFGELPVNLACKTNITFSPERCVVGVLGPEGIH
ncbi:ABC transporter ATP-binding protein [Chelativorans sp. Marseille-P2723]|uniref:ABC transporter ATP-binding protein n=1 Tax=Chelativorans sp. Marseille-P2723 TaxID=2709133 RepID=UPI001FEF00AE|nr:ABC transporter ATP-binding protein [Chelativorans sp. Marseille-P2723]